MKIIKQGKAPNVFPKRVTCSRCKSELEYEIIDIHSDLREGNYIICPVCHTFIDESLGKSVSENQKKIMKVELPDPKKLITMSEFIEQLQQTKRWQEFKEWWGEKYRDFFFQKDDFYDSNYTFVSNFINLPFEFQKGVFEAYLQHIEFDWKYSSFTYIHTYTIVTFYKKQTFSSFQELLLFAFNQ